MKNMQSGNIRGLFTTAYEQFYIMVVIHTDLYTIVAYASSSSISKRWAKGVQGVVAWYGSRVGGLKGDVLHNSFHWLFQRRDGSKVEVLQSDSK